MSIIRSWGRLSTCPVLSLAGPQELAGTSGKGKADITIVPCPRQVVRPKGTGVNLPSSDRETSGCVIWTLVKGIPTREAGWKRKLFLLSSSRTHGFLHKADHLVPRAHVTAFWLHLRWLRRNHKYLTITSSPQPDVHLSTPLSKHLSWVSHYLSLPKWSMKDLKTVWRAVAVHLCNSERSFYYLGIG